jgi:YkoP-like protein
MNGQSEVPHAPMGWVERFDRWFDRWYERKYDIRPIGEGGYIFRFGRIRHRGGRVVLDDGTTIEPGDIVGELHIDNHRAAELHHEGKSGIRFRREVLRSLPALARDLVARPDYQALAAVCGASLFWEGATRVGFENRPLPAFTRWWLTPWVRFLLARFHPAGRRRLAEGGRTELRQVWMSRRVLLERYGRRAGGECAS